MMRRGMITLCFIMISLMGSTQGSSAPASAIRIALVKNHIEKNELAAIEQLIKAETGWSYSLVDLESIKSYKNLTAFTHIWYHRTDTIRFDKSEKDAGVSIKQFVSSGGNLFLSMEAVPLLNHWGMEKTTFELRRDTLVDEGFGRPAGFHAFKSHPLFYGLNGGVYTSKQKKDHVVRKVGFFGKAIPASGKVAGIQWTYITFTEQNKLLIEYGLGKGKIIAAGAYLYYNADNYNQEHLRQFTRNVFNYTAGTIRDVKTAFWNYQPRSIVAASFKFAEIKPEPATKWNLPASTLRLTQPIASKNFYDLVGRRILWMGGLHAGVDEIWMHPYMALRDLQFGVKIKGKDSISWLKYIPASVEVTPAYLIRTYNLGNTRLKEIYTVSFDQPKGVAHIEIEGDDINSLHVKFASNLRYMWPYSSDATGTIKYAFSTSVNGHVMSGQQGALNTVVSYSSKPRHQHIRAVDSLKQVLAEGEFEIKDKKSLNVYISGSSGSITEAVNMLSDKSQPMNLLFEKSSKYYDDLLKNHLHFITPDSLFNKGYLWALARTDQFIQTTPGIGTALMAGFGTTARGWNGNQDISGRPGYAWYFGRDGQWSAMAINAYGGFAMVKQALETFIRFQDVNGKIYHELSSSGAAHYDAADATPLFVILAAHYLKYSGDITYIRERWKEIKKAIDFCYTTDTDNDNLIENTNVGHGWIEGGSLFGTHTEFYLAGTWAAALDGAAYMAGHLQQKEAATYAADARKVKLVIDRDFWNRKDNFFYNGKMKNGSYMPEATVLGAVPVYLDAVTDAAKEEKVSSRFNNKYFSTDWGIRIIEDSSRKYKPNSYHAGMVWPLYGGWAALAENKTGHYRSGYQHIMNNLLQYRQWSPGSIEETLNGDVYKPNGVCSHQCWSETMVLQPVIEGMLGLKPNAMANQLQLSPYFPWNWKHCAVRNIRMHDALFQLSMNRTDGHTRFVIDAGKPVSLSFNPAFPLNTTIKSVKINGSIVDVETVKKPEGISLHLSFLTKPGENVIEIETVGGIGILPVVNVPEPGQPSKGIQVITELVSRKKYTATVSGIPDATYTVALYHPGKIKKVSGASIVKQQDDVYTLQLKMSKENGVRYPCKTIEVIMD